MWKDKEKTEDIIAQALKIALERRELQQSIDSDQNIETVESASDIVQRGATGSCSGSDVELLKLENNSPDESPENRMMMSTPPPGIQTDSNGLILPKKVLNPCLESSDRKNLHRELMFNNKIGRSVLNQKSELQRALEKQKERQLLIQQQYQQQQQQQQQLHQQQQSQKQDPDLDLKGELSRVITERAQKLERQLNSSNQDQQQQDQQNLESQFVNPEYLNARAKLRAGRLEMK